MHILKFVLTIAFFAGSVSACSIPARSAQHEPGTRPHANSGENKDLIYAQISREPEGDQRFRSIRWSPDGARVAWIEGRPSERNSVPSQEIWSLASPRNETASSSSQSDQQKTLLVSSVQLSQALKGAAATTEPKSDSDDESKDNPAYITDFDWLSDSSSLLLIAPHALVSYELATGKSFPVITSENPISDASLSPDGRFISFVRNHSLWLVEAKGGQPHAIATPTSDGILEGEPDWPYRNELHMQFAYAWSPDSSKIAYFETDDRAVAHYSFKASNGDTRSIVYPKPGGPIPILHALIQPIERGARVEVKLGPTTDHYLPRMTWTPDSHHLVVERLDRHQQNLDLLLADAHTGETKRLLAEKDSYWINLSDDLLFINNGKEFLWSSERTGFRHLYRYDIEGKLIAQVTKGDWEVTSLDAFDSKAQRVYFTSTQRSPLERQLCSINLDGTGLETVTHLPGTHKIQFAPNAKAFADTFSSITSPPQILVSEITALDQSKPEIAAAPPAVSDIPQKAKAGSPQEKTPPQPDQPIEFLNVKLHNAAEVRAFIIKPPAFDPSHKYPVIMYLAGGPGEQIVRNMWGGPTGMWLQLMARNGFIIFAMDNHGTSGSGHYFEEPIHLRLGALELVDLRDGVTYLSSLPYVDAKRIGAYGWGYGGFLTVHALLDRPVQFKAGFAGAPVVDWRFFDAVFSERYLDDPTVHADGWDASVATENKSPQYFHGPLLIAQGTEDEFVHMENILTLQDELLDAGKSAEILLFPDRGHMIEDQPARELLYRRMTEFFLKNL